MAQLPTVGSSDWGGTLNDFLLVSHNTDGTLKDSAVDSAVTPSTGTVTSVNGNTGAVDIEIGYAPVVAASNSASNITDSADYVCTGTADQTTINSAISAAATAGGGTIFLAAGTYNITAPITISSSNITLEGTGVSTELAVVAGSNLSSVISVTGTGTVEVKLRRFFIQGSINDTSGNGISISTPWSTTDTQHIVEDVYIDGCPGHGVQVPTNSDTRVLLFNRIHVKNCKGNGFYFPWPSQTDGIFTDCITDTVGLNGFYVGGLNNHFVNCKAFYCGNVSGGGNYHGFYIVGYNNYFVNCEAQDNYQSGFYGAQPSGLSDPTYGAFGCTFVNCIADDNGQNGGTTYCKGFQIVGPQQWQIIGGVAMCRPYSSGWQKYGVSLEGGTLNTVVNGVLFYANATGPLNDTSTGPNYTAINNYTSTLAPSKFPGNVTAPALIAGGLTGATAASRYVGATSSGAPTSGTFVIGDFIIDRSGAVWICTTAGSPGTWTKVGASGGVSLPLNLSSSAASGDSFSITNTQSAPTSPTSQFIAAASGDKTVGIQVSGDTNPRFYVDSNGSMNWGSGSAATDTNLNRYSSSLLSTGSRFQITHPSTTGSIFTVTNGSTPTSPSSVLTAHAAADPTLGINVSGDTNYRLSSDSNGKLNWGSGTAAPDTDLYRSGANALTTDDAFTAQSLTPSGLTGATAATRYVGATTSGAPTSGTFNVGDFVIDQSGAVWIYVTGGTWTKAGGVTIDTNPADIQPNGVQAAGSTGKAADAGHVHQNYADQSLYLTPTGCTGESVPRRYATTGSGTLTSGTLFCAAIPLSSGIVVNKLTMVTYAAAATVTHGWYVLLDNNMVVRAVTADQTGGNWTTANSAVTLSFASSYTTTYNGLYYIGMCISASTVPKIATAPALLNSTAGLSPILCGISNTGQTTPPTTGTTMTSLTANGSFYFYGYTT